MRRIIALLFLLCCGSSAFAAQTILVFGDSLSAGYGISRQQAWPSLLESRLKDNGFSLTVVNASVSGETTAGGRNRLPALLAQHQPAWVIIELGANDGLRGLPILQMRLNLEAMIKDSQKQGAKVLLVGMQIPPNYGKQYTGDFVASFPKLSSAYKVALVPFLFEGIEGPESFLQDGVHPNASAQPVLLENVWKGLRPLLR